MIQDLVKDLSWLNGKTIQTTSSSYANGEPTTVTLKTVANETGNSLHGMGRNHKLFNIYTLTVIFIIIMILTVFDLQE